MIGHTPGPWTAHQYGVRDRGGYICELRWPSRYDGQDERYWRETAERQADARLIAAAPDLLAALIEAREQLAAYEFGITGETYNSPQINAAIAKATTPQDPQP